MKQVKSILIYIIALSQFSCVNVDNNNIEQFVKNWHNAQNNHNTEALKDMYAPLVFYFGKNRETQKVIKSKMKYFGVGSDYEESIQSDIKIIDEYNNTFSCTFLRRVIYKKKVTKAKFCLVIKNIDNHFKIVEELDAITCENTNNSNFPTNAIAPKYMCSNHSPSNPRPTVKTKIDQRGDKLYLLENNKEILLSSKLGCDAINNSQYIAWWEGVPDEYYILKILDLKNRKTKKILEERNVVWVDLTGFSGNEKFLYACYNDAGTRGSIQRCYAINLETSQVAGELTSYSVTANPKDKNTVFVYEDSYCEGCGGYETFEYIYDVELKNGKHTKTIDECPDECY